MRPVEACLDASPAMARRARCGGAVWHDVPAMGFLRRFLGGDREDDSVEAGNPAQADADERAHELDLARGEQERLDELQQRQLRYAKYAWQPPAQGGERRADDADEPPER